MHEGARDQQPPAHPAGELVDARRAPVDEIRDLERSVDGGAPLRAADPVEMREDDEVLLGREGRVEVVELRDATGRELNRVPVRLDDIVGL